MFNVYGGKSPKVQRLPFHLPNEQIIRYDPGEKELEKKLKTLKETQYTKWMETNAREYKLVQRMKKLKEQRPVDTTAVQNILNKLPKKQCASHPWGFELLYTEYPQYYSWNKPTKKWKRRPRKVTTFFLILQNLTFLLFL